MYVGRYVCTLHTKFACNTIEGVVRINERNRVSENSSFRFFACSISQEMANSFFSFGFVTRTRDRLLTILFSFFCKF
jgi:hypothetical protein